MKHVTGGGTSRCCFKRIQEKIKRDLNQYNRMRYILKGAFRSKQGRNKKENARKKEKKVSPSHAIPFLPPVCLVFRTRKKQLQQHTTHTQHKNSVEI
jgi:hypothetical protein